MLRQKNFIKKAISKNKDVSKSLIALLLRSSGVATLFALTLFLTNFYDPNKVGEYEFTRSILLLLGSLVLLGTDQSILYFSGNLVGNDRGDELFDIYRKMILAILIASIFCILVFLILPKRIFWYFFDETSSYILVLKSIGILFFYCLVLLNTEFFRAYNKFYISELYRGPLKYLPFFLALIVLYYYKWQTYLVDVYLFLFVLLAIITSLNIHGFQPVDFKKSELKMFAIVKKSLPMAISSLGFFLLLSIDVIFLKKYNDYDAIAFYSVAIKLILIVAMVMNTINSLYAPKIAEYYGKKKMKELKDLVKISSRLIFFISLPALLIMFIFSKEILGLFGTQYETAQKAFYFLISGHFFSTLCGVNGVYLNMTGRQKLFQIILLITVALNIALNWVMIPRYSINGAAIASSICVLFWNAIAVVIIYRKDGVILFIK